MDLVKLDRKLPLKAYPQISNALSEEQLYLNPSDRSPLTLKLVYLIATLFSIKSENEEKIYLALPAIKKHCWSMGFDEVKKMFEMYVDNELNLTPRSNHFDRVLVGQIREAYRQQKPTKKKEIIDETTQEEKDRLVNSGVINCFEEWKKTGNIINGYVWVYGHLIDDLKLHEFSNEEKWAAMKIAKREISEESKQLPIPSAKEVLKKIENNNSSLLKNRAKTLLLENYFSSLSKHIKEYL